MHHRTHGISSLFAKQIAEGHTALTFVLVFTGIVKKLIPLPVCHRILELEELEDNISNFILKIFHTSARKDERVDHKFTRATFLSHQHGGLLELGKNLQVM